jgi:hypothetical protein
MATAGFKRHINKISEVDLYDSSDDSSDNETYNTLSSKSKRVCFSNNLTTYSPPPKSIEESNVITHVTLNNFHKIEKSLEKESKKEPEKITILEKKMESFNLKSAQMLIDCSQSLLESIHEKIEKTKEYIEVNNFNPDYCVDNTLVNLFKEIEQIKKFQTEANALLIELLATV